MPFIIYEHRMTVVATVFLCLAPEIALNYPDSLCWNVRDNRRIHVKASPIVLLFSAILVTAAPASALSLIQFEPVANICRAERDEPLSFTLENRTEEPIYATFWADASAGVSLVPSMGQIALMPYARTNIQATARAFSPCVSDLSLRIANRKGVLLKSAQIRVSFLEARAPKKRFYIPEPLPLETELLIGAHHCPLWENEHPEMWNQLSIHPERMPALGLYDQKNPEIADWETKWAIEHGVSFFIYCWYRTKQGCPVETMFSSAIHEAFFKSRFRDKMKFTIMWENQRRGKAGVDNEKDLFDNLFPFWMETYFKHPSYLKVDNKPVLFIYRPDYLIHDLGGEAAVKTALDKMRERAKQAGFDGLSILGEYRGVDPAVLNLFKRLGLDYTFAYCWHVQHSPPPEIVIHTQLASITQTESLGILPQVITVSQAWSGWRDEGSIWKLPPADFKKLLQRVKPIIERQPKGSLGNRMLLLDNWNEWGEGHYIAPYREYGFGYLDAVREVFGKRATPHEDIVPTDIGLGPYDTIIQTQRLQQTARELSCLQRVVDAPADESLVARWSFSETNGIVALDSSGNRHGGILNKGDRCAGYIGTGFACTGGWLAVNTVAKFTFSTQLTVSCWLKTACPNQTQAWIVNRIQGGGENTGFRLGLMNGSLAFNIPVSNWSHSVTASSPVPLSRWTHVAGTYDGQQMCIYQNGIRVGSCPRTGPIYPNQFPIYVGAFAPNHDAHFTGVLDEIKLYHRALTASELQHEMCAH